MATLTPIVPGNAVGAGSSGTGWDTAANGALGDNNDATFGSVSTNATGDYTHLWELGDVDADLGNMDTLAIVLRYRWTTAPSNTTWSALEARVMTADGATVLAAASGAGAHQNVASGITTTTITNSGSTGFSYVNTSATKAQWDGARLQIRIVRTRTKGGDSAVQAVYEADLTGTYTTAAENHNGTAVLTGGGVAVLAATKGGLVAPSLTGGGVIASTASGAHTATVALTGGGVVVPAASTDRSTTATLTGGGAITVTGSGSIPGEEHDGTATLTGGGVVTLVATTDREASPTLTASGAVVLTQETARSGFVALTGGGAITTSGGAVEAHSGTVALTGGGAISTSVMSARIGAALLSGGGVIAATGTSGREGDPNLSGGGILAILQATGRFTTVALTGGGSISLEGGQAVALTDLGAVMDAIANAITDADITKRAYGYPADSISVPCAVVGFPDSIEFDVTFQRGADQTVIPVYFIVGKVTEKSARDHLASIITGATGIKDTLDGNLGGVVDTLRVTDMKILNVQVSGIDYLAAQFNAEVVV